MVMYRLILITLSLTFLTLACGGDDAPPPADATPDAPTEDANLGDAAPGDAAAGDAAPGDGSTGRDTRCDDGEPITCPATAPACAAEEVAAIQGGCWACVNAVTCAPWGTAGCAVDSDCSAREYCTDCATGSCPDCDDCVAGCVPHDCPTEPAVTCRSVRPDCGDGNVAVARRGEGSDLICWTCVNRRTCEDVDRPGS